MYNSNIILTFAPELRTNKILIKKKEKFMASMSYCCIENCAGDMGQVIDKFTRRQESIQANPYEKACIRSLYELCKEYVEAYEEYLEDTETYIAEHSTHYDDED